MAETKRKLAGRVNVAGTWYGPGDDVPDHIAEKITNPKVWSTDTADDAEAPRGAVDAGTSGGQRLARRVNVGGRWYGPDDPVPDDVASKITNPKAWEDGRLPNVVPDAAPTEMTQAQRLYGNGGFRTPTPTPAPATAAGGETAPPAPSGPVRVPPPPRSGKGSGVDAWEAFAKSQRVEVPPGATREDIIAACEDAKVLDTDR